MERGGGDLAGKWNGHSGPPSRLSAWLFANLQSDFFDQIKQSVEAAGKEMGVEVITVDAKGDAAAQVSQIQDLLTRQVQALIYIPAGATAASSRSRPRRRRVFR